MTNTEKDFAYMCALEWVITPRMALLESLREHLADLHEKAAAESPYAHRAIFECPCDIARDYRAVKGWIRQQRRLRNKRERSPE